MKVTPYPISELIENHDTVYHEIQQHQETTEQVSVIDIEEVKRNFFTMGKDEALNSLEAQNTNTQQELLSVCKSIQEQLFKIHDGIVQNNMNISQDVIDLSMSIATKIAGAAINNYGLDLIKDFLSAHLPTIKSEHTATIRISSKYKDTMQYYIDNIMSNTVPDMNIELLYDDNIQPGDCLIEIAGGKIRVDRNKTILLLEKILENLESTGSSQDMAT